MARSDPQVNIRMPQELKGRIETAANESGRSLNAEIIARLQQSFASQGLTVTQETAEILLAQIKELINVAEVLKNKNK